MTVHMFRVVAHDPSNVSESQLQRGVRAWLSNNTPWTADPVPHEVSLVDDPLTGAPVHYRGDFRFEDTDDPDALRTEIAQTLTHYCDWWRVGYHRCTHDEDNAGSCVGRTEIKFRVTFGDETVEHLPPSGDSIYVYE